MAKHTIFLLILCDIRRLNTDVLSSRNNSEENLAKRQWLIGIQEAASRRKKAAMCNVCVLSDINSAWKPPASGKRSSNVAVKAKNITGVSSRNGDNDNEIFYSWKQWRENNINRKCPISMSRNGENNILDSLTVPWKWDMKSDNLRYRWWWWLLYYWLINESNFKQYILAWKKKISK